jgi:hypothetical protein
MPIGQAMMFMCLMVAQCLLGVVLLAYGARCFQVIVEETAAGIDEVAWPDEPYLDWLARAVHLFWLVAVWLVPVGFLLRILARANPDMPVATLVLPPVIVFWLMFPLGVLSSMSANSRWVVLRPALLLGLAHIPLSLLAFYVITAALLVGCTAVVWHALETLSLLWMAVGAFAVSTTFLIYGRLLGRIAWLLGSLEPARTKPARTASARPPVRGVEVTDPWSDPRMKGKRKKKKKKRAPATPAPSQPAEGYGIAAEEPAAPPPAAPPPAAPPLDGYTPVGRDAAAVDDEPAAEGDRPRRSRIGAAPPTPPRLPLISGVYTFPWYANCLPAWIVVAALLFIMGLLLQQMVPLWGQLQSMSVG